jgi:hypothetical protein
MNVDDFFRQFGDVMQNIEFAAVEIYRAHPELTDVNVDRVYEYLQRTYQNELKNKPAPKANFSTLEQQLLQNVREMCEWRLGRAEFSKPEKVRGQFHPLSIPDLIMCFKRLRRSIEFWSGKNGGIRGYLNYVKEFVQ